ncbi:MAG: hypothetical protein HKN14_04315 [Marinicaulis sp.]|nr:hypothetical protein [Marinicaulis sp.]NNE40125.1 hypothetical protein [Marinicaulis sp.]NNL90257.1 hypothetical protein [Marinicaulis sp.]
MRSIDARAKDRPFFLTARLPPLANIDGAAKGRRAMRYLADFIMFAAGVAIGVYIFESPAHGILAGVILAGATEAAMGEKRSSE